MAIAKGVVRLRPRPRSGLRCAWCHDALGAAADWSCESCGVCMHGECRGLLERCPTLGCEDSVEVEAAAERDWMSRSTFAPELRHALARFVYVALALVIGFGLGVFGIYLLLELST